MKSEGSQRCPKCDRDLRYFVRGACYSYVTLVEIWGVYDGGLFFADTLESGGCGFAWHRWPKGSHLRQKAERYVQEWNKRSGEPVWQDDETTL
jgi:hypothetical protein